MNSWVKFWWLNFLHFLDVLHLIKYFAILLDHQEVFVITWLFQSRRHLVPRHIFWGYGARFYRYFIVSMFFICWYLTLTTFLNNVAIFLLLTFVFMDSLLYVRVEVFEVVLSFLPNESSFFRELIALLRFVHWRLFWMGVLRSIPESDLTSVILNNSRFDLFTIIIWLKVAWSRFDHLIL